MRLMKELPAAVDLQGAGTAYNTVEITGQHELRALALAVPNAYWHRERGRYVVENPSSRAARAILRLFPERVIEHPELVTKAEEDYTGDDARPYDFASELNIQLDVGTFKDGKNLYDWQDTDGGYIAAIMERDEGAFINWEPGLGKTVVTAAFIKKFGWRKTIVVCRNDAKQSVWEDQLRELLGNAVELVVIPNAKAARDRTLDTIANWPQHAKPFVFIIHYEALRVVADAGEKGLGGRGKGWTRVAGEDGFDAIVYDEGHRLSSLNPNVPKKNAQSHKALMYLRKNHVRNALNLTGSGIQNHEEDLFGQLHFMKPKTYRAKWADWNDRYLDFVKVGERRVCIGFQADKIPQLRKEMGVFTVYRKKREVFPDLPEPIIVPRHLELYPDQRRAYNEMRDNFWTTIEEEGLKAASPVAQMTRLRQIATYWPGLDSIKIDTAIGELEETPDEQFVIFTWFKEPGHALAERYGDDCIIVDGDVPIRHRPELLRRHQTGQARILVGSIATLGESLNLQYCSEAIRLDRDWNPQVNKQTLDRLDRDGQHNRVTLRELWAKDTVDTLRVFPRLVGKESLRRALYG
jgi:hypothetical protein